MKPTYRKVYRDPKPKQKESEVRKLILDLPDVLRGMSPLQRGMIAAITGITIDRAERDAARMKATL